MTLSGSLPTLSALKKLEKAAWALWGTALIVISIIAWLHPERSVTHVYAKAALAWWNREDLYSTGIHGFLYLPISAILYTPFALLGGPLGDMAWRLCSVAIFTFGAWRMCHTLLSALHARTCFALVLLLVLPSAGVNLLRGQSELMMFALMMLATIDIIEERWHRAGFLLAFTLALKPLAIILALLCLPLYPKVWRGFLVALLLGALIVTSSADWDYILRQHAMMIDKMLVAVDPGTGRWNSFDMMMARFGVPLSADILTLIRIIMAGSTFILALIARYRFDKGHGAFCILTLATCYLLIFNPRTELGSYMNLATLAICWAGICYWKGQTRPLAFCLWGLALALGNHAYGDWIYRPTDVWLKPLLACVFMTYLATNILGTKRIGHALRHGQ